MGDSIDNQIGMDMNSSRSVASRTAFYYERATGSFKKVKNVTIAPTSLPKPPTSGYMCGFL